MPVSIIKPDLISGHQEPLLDQFEHSENNNLLIHYLGDVFDWHGYVKFLSLAALRETSKDVPLENLFVEPCVATQHLAPEAFDGGNLPEAQALSAALRENQRLVLLGDPGSGKSTVVNWICTMLGRGMSGPLASLAGGPLVPVPMVLRELGIGSGFAKIEDAGQRWLMLLEMFLRRPVAAQLLAERGKHGGNFDACLLARMLESGQAMLLLDGIDEIGSIEVRKALREAVQEGMRRYPRCRWVLTSRIVGYDEVLFDVQITGDLPSDADWIWANFIRKSGELPIVDAIFEEEWPNTDVAVRWSVSSLFPRLYLAPFNNQQIAQFTRLWWGQHESNPHLVGTKPQQFQSALEQSPGARSLARLPHLLTMIAQIYRVLAELPDGRAVLYSLITVTYLGTLDKERGLEHLRPITHGIDEMRRWLAVIGWHLQRRRGERENAGKKKETANDILINKAELKRILAEVIVPTPPADKNTPPLSKEETAELFLEYAGRRSGLLLPRGMGVGDEEQYAFLHLSFQEYFAAEFLRERVCDLDWAELEEENKELGTRPEDLRRYAGSELWRETLIFLFESAALENKTHSQRLLVRLLEWPREVARWGSFPAPDPAIRGYEKRWMEWERKSVLPALVAALSVNPHLTFDDNSRHALWKRCLQFEMGFQKHPFLSGGTVIQELFSRSTYADGVGRELAELEGSADVKRLNLSRCLALKELPDLRRYRQLSGLDLSGCINLEAISSVARLVNLRQIRLRNCSSLESVASLIGLPHLEHLGLAGCTALTDLHLLGGLTHLETIMLGDVIEEVSYSFLASLQKLEQLTFIESTKLKDWSQIPTIGTLENLLLFDCHQIKSLNGLDRFKKLSQLRLNGCNGISDLSPLQGIPSLKKLEVYNCPGIPKEKREEFKKLRPDVEIN